MPPNRKKAKETKNSLENDENEDENGEQSLLNESERDYPAENETFATSEATSVVSNGELLKFQIDRSAPTRKCSKCSLQFFLTVTFSIFVYISPILFLTLPKIIPPLFDEIPGDHEPISNSAADIGTVFSFLKKINDIFKDFKGSYWRLRSNWLFWCLLLLFIYHQDSFQRLSFNLQFRKKRNLKREAKLRVKNPILNILAILASLRFLIFN